MVTELVYVVSERLPRRVLSAPVTGRFAEGSQERQLALGSSYLAHLYEQAGHQDSGPPVERPTRRDTRLLLVAPYLRQRLRFAGSSYEADRDIDRSCSEL